MGNDIIGGLLGKVDQLGSSAVQSLYNSLASALMPVFTAGMVIYVCFWGYQILFGKAQASPSEMVWRLGRVMLVYAMAFSWSDFSVLVVDVLSKVPDSIGSAVCSAVGGKNCATGAQAGSQGLSEVWTAANTVASNIAKTSGWFGLAMMIFSYIIMFIAMLFIAFAAFLIIFGKMALFVLLALAPLFIACALFGVSYFIFDGWMRSCVGYAFIPVIVHGFLGFFLVLMNTTVSELSGTQAQTLTTIAPFLLMNLVGFFLLTQILKMTAALAGGAVLQDDATGRAARWSWKTGKAGAGIAAYGIGRGGAAAGRGGMAVGRAVMATDAAQNAKADLARALANVRKGRLEGFKG